MAVKYLSYRLYTQPLTLKSESKPVDGELVVDTENGHIFIYDEVEDQLNSATTKLHAEMSMNRYLVDKIVALSDALTIQINANEVAYDIISTKENLNTTQLNELLKDVKSLSGLLVTFLGDLGTLSQELLTIYNTLSEWSQLIFGSIKNKYEIERINAEFSYLVNLVRDTKARVLADGAAVKALHVSVKNLRDTRLDKSEYDTWATTYVNNVKAIKGTSKTIFRKL